MAREPVCGFAPFVVPHQVSRSTMSWAWSRAISGRSGASGRHSFLIGNRGALDDLFPDCQPWKESGSRGIVGSCEVDKGSRSQGFGISPVSLQCSLRANQGRRAEGRACICQTKGCLPFWSLG